MDDQIDVEELICELHHIAGSERIDVDVRKVAAEAESALAAMRACVNELQMNTAEREAVEWARCTAKIQGLETAAATLLDVLKRQRQR